MNEDQNFSAYFSRDGSDAYVLTDDLPRVVLKQRPEPEDAPLYLDMETGDGFYPEGVSAQEAYNAAEYAKDRASSDVLIHLKQDTEAWRREFSELFDTADLGTFWSLDMDDSDDGRFRF